MKARLFSITLLIILLSVSTNVFADSGKTYKLDELGMSITVPSDFVVFTRDVSDNDPNLELYGLTKSGLLDMMKSRNIYLDLWDDYVDFEIIVTMVDSKISDFNLLSDTILTTLISNYIADYKIYDITVSDYEIYQHSQKKKKKIYQSKPNEDSIIYGLQYYTVYDNKAINITLQSFSGKIDASKENIVKSIVDSVFFDKAPQNLPSSIETAAFVYSDTDAECEFTVPANWSKGDFIKDRDILEAKFTSNKDAGCSILYGGIDYWIQLPENEKRGYSRSDVNNSWFTENEFAEMMEVSISNVSKVTYAGKEYFKIESDQTTSSYGIDIVIKMTNLYRIENGYLYMFSYCGDSSNSSYKDFESLMKSVKYLGESSLELGNSGIGSKSSNTGSQNISTDFDKLIGELISGLIVTVIVYSVPIIILRYVILRHPVSRKSAIIITVIYGIISLIIMFLIFWALNDTPSGKPIIFWSIVNYNILHRGYKKYNDTRTAKQEYTTSAGDHFDNMVTTNTQIKQTIREPIQGNDTITGNNSEQLYQPIPTPIVTKTITDNNSSEFVFCYNCGTKYSVYNNFCTECGAKNIKRRS